MDVSDFGPSHIINIKKEKRETDEETKQILRMLQKDDVSGHGRGGFGATGGAVCPLCHPGRAECPLCLQGC